VTLIEALVAVALTVMLSALGFAQVDAALAGLRLSQATAMVSSDLRMARANAQRQGAATFRVSGDGRFYSADARRFVELPRGIGLDLAGDRPLTFFADGSSTGGAVAVQNARGRTVLQVDAVTGTIRREPAR
jgi:general secretion pathway protein H